jgi:hypothetical protein
MGLFDKIKKSLEQAKEDKIQSDPKLKSLWAKTEKDSKELKKQGEKLDDLLGLTPSDDDDDD